LCKCSNAVYACTPAPPPPPHHHHHQAEKAELEREFEEIKKQLEEDADREIEDIKEKYEQRLQVRMGVLYR
jgi:hypothetical protein